MKHRQTKGSATDIRHVKAPRYVSSLHDVPSLRSIGCGARGWGTAVRNRRPFAEQHLWIILSLTRRYDG